MSMTKVQVLPTCLCYLPTKCMEKLTFVNVRGQSPAFPLLGYAIYLQNA